MVQAGHTNRLTSLSIDRESRYFATGAYDNALKLWDLKSGKLIQTLHNDDTPYAVEFSPDGTSIYTGDYGNKGSAVKVWPLDIWGFYPMEMESGCKRIGHSQDGKFLYMGFTSGYVGLWDAVSGDGIRYYSIEGKNAGIGAVDISSDSRWIAAGGDDWTDSNQLRVWGTDADSVLFEMKVAGKVSRIQFRDNDSLIYVEMNDLGFNRIDLLNWRNGRIVRTLKGDCITVIPPKGQVAVNDAEYKVTILDADLRPEYSIPVSEKSIDDMKVSLDGKYLVMGGRDILVWDLEKKKELYTIEGARWRESMAFSPTGDQIVFNGDHGEIVNWDFRTGEIKTWEGHKGEVLKMSFNSEGDFLGSLGRDSTAILWDAGTGQILYRKKFYSSDFNSVTLNPTGEWMAICLKDSVYSMNTATGEIVDPFSMGVDIDKILYSPNNRDNAFLISSFLIVYDLFESQTRLNFSLNTGTFEDMAYSSDGEMIAAGGYADSLIVYDLAADRMKYVFPYDGEYVTSLAFSPTWQMLVAGFDDGMVRFYDLRDGSVMHEVGAHGNLVNGLAFRNDGLIMASTSWDGQITIWDVTTLRRMAGLYAFKDGTWAVVDANGRYDASGAGDNPNLHFVVGLKEILQLDQLKERYYEPGLLQKLLGFNEEPMRDVAALKEVGLFPEVKLSLEGDLLSVVLKERNGGIGNTSLFINGKEVNKNIYSGRDTILVDLIDYGRYLKPGPSNEIEVVAYNEQGYLRSSGNVVTYEYVLIQESSGNGFGFGAKTELFAVVVGTADYRGTDLDLKYADRDAAYMATAVSNAGRALFGSEAVHVQLLSTDGAHTESSKTNIKAAFENIYDDIGAEDVLLVYLSGHGVNYGGQDGQFYYLTSGLDNGDLSDEVLRKNYAISTLELTEWINELPAGKQVLILDACASGKAIEDLAMVQEKGISTSQVRALERMKDRTGMFLIAGSAADKVSFEASQYGQSLLTYSLLSGMNGRALREGEFVDVINLFQFAIDEVPSLARNIGGIQKPMMAVPYGGGSFDIGRVDASVEIPLESVKPVFIRSNFQEEFAFDDILGLSQMIDQKFRDMGAQGKSNSVIFVDVTNYPEAYSIKGRYSVDGDLVKLEGRVFKGKAVLGDFTAEGTTSGIDTLLDNILQKATAIITE